MKSIRTLMSRAIDYAGVFPPASLSMPEAVRNYARYRKGEHAWALGNFVVPLSRLEEFEAAAEGLRVDQRIPLSVILPSFDCDVSPLARGPGFGNIVSAEVRITEAAQVGAVASTVPPGTTNYFEVPARGNREDLLSAISQEGERAKLRTGGVEPGTIPAPLEIVNFLFECRRTRLAFKATAGLHHAIRGNHALSYEKNAAVEVTHGFLNLLLAAALVFIGGEPDAVRLTVEEEQPNAFRFHDDRIEWHGASVSTEQVNYAREQFAIGFGSCSFEEPLEDLRSLGLV